MQEQTIDPRDIVERIAAVIESQTEALAAGDFARLEALTVESEHLCRALGDASAGLPAAECARLAAMLQPATEQAARLVDNAGSQLGETRREVQEVRQGRTATSAYRQASPREAAMRFSRQG